MSKKIVLAGGSGMVGKALYSFFQKKGYDVLILSTQKNSSTPNTLYWNPKENIFPKIDEKIVAIINLAGGNIGDKYWTQSRKKELEESRVLSANLIAQKIDDKQLFVDHFIQFTAIGYYGSNSDQWQDEDSPKGNGFLSDLVEKWENAATVKNSETLFTILRLGVVMDSKQGAWPKMIKTIPFGINLVFGKGQNYISTIALSEIAPKVLNVLENKKTGIINLVDGNPKTQHQLLLEYAKSIDKSIFTIKIPAFFLKKLLGDFSQIMLDSQRIKSKYQ